MERGLHTHEVILVFKEFDDSGDGRAAPSRRPPPPPRLPHPHTHRRPNAAERRPRADADGGPPLARRPPRRPPGRRGPRGARPLDHALPKMAGQLDHEEFKHALSVLGVQLPPSKVRQLFRMFDSDGSGEVQYEEFCGL